LDFRAEIKQLGLELRPAQGPREFLILDHVERPTPDGLVPTLQAPVRAMRTNVDEGFVDVISVLLMTEGVLTLAWTAGVSRLRPAHRASTGAA
jgi:hypothetical protein